MEKLEEEIMAVKCIKMKSRWMSNNFTNLKYDKLKMTPKFLCCSTVSEDSVSGLQY